MADTLLPEVALYQERLDMREKTFDVGKGIKLKFNEHNVPIPERIVLGFDLKRRFTVTLIVGSNEDYSRDHYIYTRDLNATVRKIENIIACLRDDTPLDKIVESLKTLLEANHILCGGVASVFNVELNVAEYLIDYYTFHSNILEYIMGDTRVTLTETPGDGYCLIDFPHTLKSVQRVYISLFSGKLIYFFTTRMIPTARTIPIMFNEHCTKYQAVNMDTFDTDLPLHLFYCEKFRRKSETYFLPGIKRVHIEGTDLVILRKVIGILEINIPNIAQDLILENTFFEYGGIRYCAVHQRINLHTKSHVDAWKMIDYLNGVLGPNSKEKWENIERVMNQRHRMHVLPDSNFTGFSVISKSPDLNIEDQKKISSFLVGDDTPYIETKDGCRTLKYFIVHGNYKEAIIKWIGIGDTGLWDAKMDVMKKNQYVEVDVSLNDLSDGDPPLSITNLPGKGVSSKFNSQKEYLYTTLRVLNHILDKPL
jgi:hypothetical protein